MDWLTGWLANTSIESMLNALGLGALAILFATDRIKTRGQATRDIERERKAHERLIAEKDKTHGAIIEALVDKHTDQLAYRDDRISELKGALASMEQARNVERDRAESATAMLGRAVEAVEVSNHLLESLGEAVKDGAQ